MAASREPTMTDARVMQTSKATVDEFFNKDFCMEAWHRYHVDLDGASAAYNDPDSVSSQGDWLQVVNRGLTNLLKKRPENIKIFKWIECYVAETQKKHPEFIHALVTIICRNAADGEGQGRYIDPEILKQRVPVLQRYIDNKRPLELHALYAVQAFDHSLHSPSGLLRILFGVLYDEDVCSEESFNDWKGGKQPNYPVDTMETKLLTSDKTSKPCFKHDDAIKTEELFRNFTSILNKLTDPQLLTELTEKALQLPIDTEERVKGVISLVFEKAISEPNFSTAYAHMCQKLSQLKVQSVATPGQQVQFRPILVHTCQLEFEKEKQTEIDEAQRRKEIAQLPTNQQEAQLELLQENLFKAKRRMMGNIRFIGELYKLRILTENTMHNCVMKLLKAKDDESLECLCCLMENIGKDLDHERAKNWMDQYFSKIDKIIASQTNAPKIQCLMHDLVDQRKSNWVPRRQESKPTTIDAIHKELHIAESKKAEDSSKNDNGPSRSREQAPPPCTVTPQADDGWNTVPTTNKTRTAYDPSKLKLTRWSPVNPEGKKQYDRDFLLQFQKRCTYKPDGLPNIPEVVLDRAVVQPLNLSSDFMPLMKRPKVQSTTSEDAKRIHAKFASKVAIVASDLPQSLPKSPRPHHPVPSQSPRVPSPLVSPVAVNTHPHDMNKQGAPSRPAMAASPQQGILPNQPNPGGPPIMNMGQVRFQAPRQALPRGYQQQQMPQQVYSVRQNQAQMQGIQQYPQAGGPAAQQGANTAQIKKSNAAAAASGQYKYMQQGQPQYIMTGATPIVPQMAHRPYQQSYPQVYQPPTPPYYSSPPQQVWLNPATQATPRQPFTSQPPAPRPDSQQQRKKTIIRSVDPSTNQDVTEKFMHDTSGSSPPHSGRSSANVTPPVCTTSSEDAKCIQS